MAFGQFGSMGHINIWIDLMNSNTTSGVDGPCLTPHYASCSSFFKQIFIRPVVELYGATELRAVGPTCVHCITAQTICHTIVKCGRELEI